MFIENEYARPLFDFEKGGPPKAFQCLCLDAWKVPCNKVTRTERGMRMHLKIVHLWKEQPSLYSMDNQPAQKQKSLSLLNLSPSVKNQIKVAAKKTARKLQETNDGELLKLMNVEK